MLYINLTLPYQVIGKEEGNQHLLSAYYGPNSAQSLQMPFDFTTTLQNTKYCIHFIDKETGTQNS